MRTLLLADICGNLHALEAVLAACGPNSFDRIVCLGGIAVGGPNPREVLKWVSQNCDWSLLKGFHDHMLLDPRISDGSSSGILNETTLWSRDQFHDEEGRELLKWLSQRPDQIVEQDKWYVAGSPWVPKGGLAEWRYGPTRADYIAKEAKGFYDAMPKKIRLCICAGEGWPALIRENGLVVHSSHLPIRIKLEPGQKYVFALGSVGRPRDYDPKASYAILEDTRFTFNRVDYDYDGFVRAVSETSLPRRLAEWRLEGR